MPVDDICDLALDLPIADDAALFLWATAPKLAEALVVMTAWGFDYRTCAVWDKGVIGMGYWFRQQHELLLVGARGDFHRPEPPDRVSSVIEAPRGQHSVKPDVVYDLLETMFPDGTLLELFARANGRERWTTWGLEA